MIQKKAKWYRNEVIPALEKWRPEDRELEVSLNRMISYIARKKKKKQEKEKEGGRGKLRKGEGKS